MKHRGHQHSFDWGSEDFRLLPPEVTEDGERVQREAEQLQRDREDAARRQTSFVEGTP